MTSVAVSELCFSWATKLDQNLIGPLSFRIETGETIGVFGRSGTGKTTLMRLLKGELTPNAGHIEIPPDIHRVYHDQNQKLIPWLTAYKNITLNIEQARISSIELKTAKLVDAFGVSEFLERDATKLSGGQRARVALARSLVEPCDLLLLDEPFAGIDARSQDLLVEQIKIGASSRMTLLSSHDPGLLVAVCDKVLCLVEKDGQVFADEFKIEPSFEDLDAHERRNSKRYLPEVQRLLGFLYV